MKRWSGRILRFVVDPFPPFNILYSDAKTGELRAYGTFASLIGNVTAAMNMTCSVIRSTDATYGTVIEETGEVNGMLKTILDDDGDIAGPFVDHPVLVEKFYCVARNRDMSSPFGIVSGMKRQYIDVPSSLADAFDATTWLALSGSFVLALSVLASYSWLVYRPASMTVADAIFKWFFVMLAALVQEATTENTSKRWFERCFLGVWLLMCTLLSYTFLGTLKANLIVLTPTLRIDDTHQLVQHPELTVFYGAKTQGENYIQLTPGEVGDRLRQHVKQNSEGILPLINLHSDYIRDALAEERGVVMMVEKFMKVAISRWCLSSPYFFYLAKTPHSFMRGGPYASRRLPLELLQEMDMKIMWLEALAIPFMNERELLQGHLGCLAGSDKKISETMKAIRWRDLNGIDTVLFMGLASSIAVFLVEILVFHALRSIRKHL